MPIIVSLLRGINLARHNRIQMHTLRSLYESLNLQNVQTWLQSGNVIFTTKASNLGQLGKTIESAIERTAGFRPDVILRTPNDLKAIANKNPFATRRGIDPSRFVVGFLANEPGPQARAKILALKTEPEELRIQDREIYIYYPNGLARPKVSWTSIEKILQTRGTCRNWNTVTKLLDIVDKLETNILPRR